MKVALVHDHYQQPGGEDQVFAAEGALLEANGHAVTRYAVHNDDVAHMGRVALAKATLWNSGQYRRLRALFEEVRPDVVHVHNTLPLVSPAVYYAAKRAGAAVVQTLHNYRLDCVNGLFYRDGHVCEDCLGKRVAWPGVLHACYRGSRPASAVVASMLAYHKARGTYEHRIDRYIALTEFARQKFMAMGLPAEKVAVKPNFVAPDPGVGTGEGGYAVFVGRLSEEKGVHVLLDAWRRLGEHVPVKVLGDGPLAEQVRGSGTPGVRYLGRQPRSEVLRLLADASFLVFPSVWYETFGMTIVEAFATGTPVVASRLGSAASIVADGRTGALFEPGNATDLACKVEELLAAPETLAEMRVAARAEYEARYTAEVNYRTLMGIYRAALGVA